MAGPVGGCWCAAVGGGSGTSLSELPENDFRRSMPKWQGDNLAANLLLDHLTILKPKVFSNMRLHSSCNLLSHRILTNNLSRRWVL